MKKILRERLNWNKKIEVSDGTMGDRQTKGILTPTHPHAEIYLFLKSSRKCNMLPAKSASCIFLLHCRTDELNDYQKRYESSQEMVEMVALYQKWMAIEEK